MAPSQASGKMRSLQEPSLIRRGLWACHLASPGLVSICHMRHRPPSSALDIQSQVHSVHWSPCPQGPPGALAAASPYQQRALASQTPTPMAPIPVADRRWTLEAGRSCPAGCDRRRASRRPDGLWARRPPPRCPPSLPCLQLAQPANGTNCARSCHRLSAPPRSWLLWPRRVSSHCLRLRTDGEECKSRKPGGGHQVSRNWLWGLSGGTARGVVDTGVCPVRLGVSKPASGCRVL